MVAVQAEGLKFNYRQRVVLRSVDLAVQPGSVVSIVGANGAGKTTLLKCLTGILRPAAGRVAIAGHEIGQISRQKLATLLAFVPQAEPSRFPLSVFDAVLLGRRPYLGWYPKREDLEIVSHAIDRLGLTPLALRHLNQLSGGERQKVSIARAIAQQPTALLLDEPTTYLDLKHQLTVLEILESLARDGVAVIMSIHDLNLAFRVSDRIMLLDDGTIVDQGPPETITSDAIRQVYGVECDLVDTGGQRIVVPRRISDPRASVARDRDPHASEPAA